MYRYIPPSYHKQKKTLLTLIATQSRFFGSEKERRKDAEPIYHTSLEKRATSLNFHFQIHF